MGDYSYICPGTQLTCAEVGKFCSVATGCLIGLAAHHLRGLSTSPVFTERDNPTGFRWTEAHEEDVLRPVSIGNDVWIGARVIVLGGVTIGNGAVIGAGSVVTRDVPSYAVVAGTPARLIRYRFEEPVIRRLEERELVATEPTEVITKSSGRRNGNLLFTLRPIGEVIDDHYASQLAELELAAERHRVSNLLREQESPA